jgi:hypothetical protein
VHENKAFSGYTVSPNRGNNMAIQDWAKKQFGTMQAALPASAWTAIAVASILAAATAASAGLLKRPQA